MSEQKLGKILISNLGFCTILSCTDLLFTDRTFGWLVATKGLVTGTLQTSRKRIAGQQQILHGYTDSSTKALQGLKRFFNA